MHIIRLREPWRIERRQSATTYKRVFHRPTGLSESIVWLAIEGLSSEAEVILNGELLSSDQPQSCFEITSLLQDTNEVQISVANDSATPPFSEVRLEIR